MSEIVEAETTGRPAPDAASGSFDDLYRSQWLPMVRLATLTTGSQALAEEIVQDAFAEVLRRWASIDVPGGYLRRAVVNRCVSWVRRQQVERRVDRSRHAVVHDQHVIETIDLLDVLTPRQRAAVVLRYPHDLSEAEIARALSCRPGTVKSLLSRSLSRLQEVV